MTGFSGADADALESAGRQLSGDAGSVERIRTTLRQQLYTSHWEGPAADRYRQSWDQVHALALAEAEAFLRACADRLAANAQDQRRASETGDAGGFDLGKLLSGLDPLDDLEAAANLLLGLLDDALAWAGMSTFLGAFGVVMGALDLFFDDEGYGGGFVWLERAVDVAGMIAGALAVGAGIAVLAGVAAAGSPVILTVTAIGAGIGVLAVGVDLAMKKWVSGGREIWNEQVAPFLSKSWNSFTGAVDDVWDSAFETGRDAWHGVSDFVSDGVDAVVEGVDDALDAITSPLQTGWRALTGG